MTGYFIDGEQKILDSLIKVALVGEVDMALRSGSKSRFGITGFSTSNATWTSGFSLNNCYLSFKSPKPRLY